MPSDNPVAPAISTVASSPKQVLAIDKLALSRLDVGRIIKSALTLGLIGTVHDVVAFVIFKKVILVFPIFGISLALTVSIPVPPVMVTGAF